MKWFKTIGRPREKNARWQDTERHDQWKLPEAEWTAWKNIGTRCEICEPEGWRRITIGGQIPSWNIMPPLHSTFNIESYFSENENNVCSTKNSESFVLILGRVGRNNGS